MILAFTKILSLFQLYLNMINRIEVTIDRSLEKLHLDVKERRPTNLLVKGSMGSTEKRCF